MKVLMLNGSPNEKGCTYTALCQVGKILNDEGIDYEIFHLKPGPVRDCIGCMRCNGQGCIFNRDSDASVEDFVRKAREADGFVFGTPVYYSHPSGSLLSFLDRVFFGICDGFTYEPFAHKPAAAVVSARRAGTTSSIDILNKYFSIAQMPVAGSTYWNMVHGWKPSDVTKDLEGMQTLRNLGRNLSWLLKCFEAGRKKGITPPEAEKVHMTNFI